MSIPWNKVTWYTKLGALIVVVIAISLGFYFWNEYQEIQILKIDTPQDTKSSSITEELGESELQDWQTNRNEEFRFEIEYPDGWRVEDRLEKDSCCLNVFNSNNPYDGAFLKDDVMKAQFQYHIDKTLLSKQAYIDKLVRNESGDPITPISESSITNLETENDLDIIKFKGGPGNIGYVVPIKEDFSEIIYVIVWNPDPLFESVLSTFRFIEPVDTSDWQTYRSEEFGFEVKYPPNMLAGKLPGLLRGVSLTFQEDTEYIVNERVEVVLECEQNAFYKTTGTTVENSIVFDVGEWFEGAAGPNYYGTVYSTKKEERCYRLTYVRGKGSGGFYSSDSQEIERIDSTIKSEDEKYSATFDQILSTFRFIEDEIDIPKAGFIPGQSDAIRQLPEPGLVTSIIIDYSKCSRGSDRVQFGLGATQFAFEGVTNENCVFYHGTGIEDPNWDGSLPNKCNVPTNLNKQTYTVNDFGIEMDALEQYCIDLSA